MHPDQWRQVTTVFHAALAREHNARAAFIDAACGEDSDVRAEVERLLAAHEQAGHFGEEPVAADLGKSLPTVLTHTAAPIVSEPALDRDQATSEAVSRRLRHPFLWITSVAAIVSLGSFIYAASVLILNKGATKEFGWREAREGNAWVVRALDPERPPATGLEVGDRILALNGVPPVPRGGTIPLRRQLSIGDG